MIYCLFEQSGTFKNEFIKLGFDAVDVDISNDFGSTDIVCDLFSEIVAAYTDKPSFFDDISCDDFIFAFFPCDCFSTQFRLDISSSSSHLINMSPTEKLLHSIYCHNKLNDYYILFCEFFYILYARIFKAVIENPFHDSYLKNAFPIKPKLIDYDRRQNGDFYKKPTQFFFINYEPKNNVIFEALPLIPSFNIDNLSGAAKKIMRSKISDIYANRFIRQFILPLEV